MKNPIVLAALSGILAFDVHGVNAGCYEHGNEYLKAQANQFAHDACYNNGGMFTGWFNPSQTKSMCPRDVDGVSILYEIQNLNSQAGFDLGDGDCYGRLANIIAGCHAGGEDNVAGWRFRVDTDACFGT